MAWLITPGQLTSRSELFHQLAQVTAAGIGLIGALEILQRNPPRPSLRAPIGRMLQQLNEGGSFSDSLKGSGRWLSSFDVALLQAGEQSGRLPDCFRVLANYYAQRAQLARQVIGFVIYPLVVFHVAVLIFPIDRFTDLILKGAVVPYVFQKLCLLLPIYALVWFVAYSLQSTHAEKWRAMVERWLGMVPILGQARRSLSIARLSVALEALLNAGVTVIEAWDLAAAASGSPALRRAVAQYKPELVNGRTPSEMVSSSGVFPATFASLYHSGEISGTLDDALKRSHVMFEEEGSRKMKQFIFGLAGALVGCVMLMAAWNIIRFYMGYFQQINDAINMNAQ
ncbi:MAG TPA: type II secretion system F family protein [Methylomirabilota bacterium]|nr:type II secretion system F family protein [Methylomirabilota bacterium]